MQNRRLNRRGASLIEILAIITLSALVLSIVTNIISFNLRQNALNQEKMTNSAVANAVGNYVKSIPFDQLQLLLYAQPEASSYVRTFDEAACNELFPPGEKEIERDRCLASIYPTVNDRNFRDNIHIILLPYDHAPSIIAFHDANTYPTLDKRLDELVTMFPNPLDEQYNENIIRIFVIVESNISDSNDLYIEKVTTNEKNKILQ